MYTWIVEITIKNTKMRVLFKNFIEGSAVVMFTYIKFSPSLSLSLLSKIELSYFIHTKYIWNTHINALWNNKKLSL